MQATRLLQLIINLHATHFAVIVNVATFFSQVQCAMVQEIFAVVESSNGQRRSQIKNATPDITWYGRKE